MSPGVGCEVQNEKGTGYCREGSESSKGQGRQGGRKGGKEGGTSED